MNGSINQLVGGVQNSWCACPAVQHLGNSESPRPGSGEVTLPKGHCFSSSSSDGPGSQDRQICSVNGNDSNNNIHRNGVCGEQAGVIANLSGSPPPSEIWHVGVNHSMEELELERACVGQGRYMANGFNFQSGIRF